MSLKSHLLYNVPDKSWRFFALCFLPLNRKLLFSSLWTENYFISAQSPSNFKCFHPSLRSQKRQQPFNNGPESYTPSHRDGVPRILFQNQAAQRASTWMLPAKQLFICSLLPYVAIFTTYVANIDHNVNITCVIQKIFIMLLYNVETTCLWTSMKKSMMSGQSSCLRSDLILYLMEN